MTKRRDELMFQLFETMNGFRRQMIASKMQRFHKKRLGNSQQQLLMCVAHRRDDGITIKELAEQLQVTSGAVTQMVDALETEGFIERREDPDDRRSVRIFFAKKAHKQFGHFKTAKLNFLGQLLEPLDDEELEQLISLLTKISNHKSEGDLNA
jgi:DNA-binding MarR family transcriptional regulator